MLCFSDNMFWQGLELIMRCSRDHYSPVGSSCQPCPSGQVQNALGDGCAVPPSIVQIVPMASYINQRVDVVILGLNFESGAQLTVCDMS